MHLASNDQGGQSLEAEVNSGTNLCVHNKNLEYFRRPK
jgi:hypothetical protein